MIASEVDRYLFTAGELSLAVDGQLVESAESLNVVHSVVIDSRESEHGSLFVPLRGRRHDGHEFIGDSIRRGATVVMVSEDYWKREKVMLDTSGRRNRRRNRASFVIVADPLVALQRLARHHMDRLHGVLRIGVTGSNGKTTTKELVGSVLRQSHRTQTSSGNFNSEIGVPLSAFSVGPADEYSVFEMAVNHCDEMEILAGIVKPDVAVITNIGSAHVGLLGSRDQIAAEKKKIFSFFDGGQAAFILESDRYARYLAEGVNGTVVAYGPESTPGYRGSEDLGLDGSIIHWEETQIHFPLFGRHNLLNALAAISVGVHLGIDRDDIVEGVQQVKPLFGRSEIIRGPVTVIQDCYNSNAEAAEQMLRFLGNLSWPGRKIAMLGSMLELGEHSESEHARVLAGYLDGGFSLIVLVGEEFRNAYDRSANRNDADRLCWVSDTEALIGSLEGFVDKGDLVLLKASRGIELERVVPWIEARFGGVTPGGTHGS